MAVSRGKFGVALCLINRNMPLPKIRDNLKGQCHENFVLTETVGF